MHHSVASLPNFAFAISLLCLPTLRQKHFFGKFFYSLSDNTSMFYQSWCAVCYSPFLRWRIWVRQSNCIQTETKLHVHILAYTLLQPNFIQWTLFLTWRFLRVSQRPCRVIDLVTRRHVTFAISERKPAYPAHTQPISEDGSLLPSLIRKAATVRNTQVTLSGKTPMELAMGRTPRDVTDPAFLNPEQLTSTSTKQDFLNEEIQKIGYEGSSWSLTTRRHSPRSCWTDEVCSSRCKSRRAGVLLARYY